ncbi:MAG: hypothetical protein WA989_14595 [Henriciella sp.]|uniref:hypothetical protein n=1 Tax=Henriciella sp. TaxID=1968823 RepID=UPI003C71117B
MLKQIAGIAVFGAVAALAGCDVDIGRADTDDQAGMETAGPADPDPVETADTNRPEAVTGAESEPDQPVRPAAASRTAEIDWEAARTDLASSPASEDDGAFNIQSGSTAPPVPVLLPTMPVRPAGTTDGPQPQFRPVPDGYFAVFPGQDYNLIVNGTNLVTDIPNVENVETEDMTYSETTTGAIVSFSRYGADYMIEFECLGSGEEGGDCITEDEAKAVAEEIVISGTQ